MSFLSDRRHLNSFCSVFHKQSAQDEADKGKELPLVPQLKPPRQPPEVKHKSQMCTAAHLAISTSAPAAVSAQRQEEEEEEEEEKVLKELQVY